ncbi:hypothetical protein SDJN03_20605, partial [Cucurbita argyrosperma subsp. sororia]
MLHVRPYSATESLHPVPVAGSHLLVPSRTTEVISSSFRKERWIAATCNAFTDIVQTNCRGSQKNLARESKKVSKREKSNSLQARRIGGFGRRNKRRRSDLDPGAQIGDCLGHGSAETVD